MTASVLFNNAELALASYANLNIGTADTSANKTALKIAGMTQKEAEEFVTRYTEVVAVYSDPSTDFQATVFKAADGSLTLACRGTLGAVDILEDVATIFPFGCAYDQIVSMYNWWQRATNDSDYKVAQFDVQRFSPVESVPAGAVWLNTVIVNFIPVSTYLVPIADATGEGSVGSGLMAALANDPLVDVTGHSLGGHLAMAFASIFPAGQVTTFNAPGFRSDMLTNNEAFFAALGGHVPKE